MLYSTNCNLFEAIYTLESLHVFSATDTSSHQQVLLLPIEVTKLVQQILIKKKLG